MSDERQLSDDERQLMTHISMWGSDGYPVRKLGRGWTWGPFLGIKGPPAVFPSKTLAVRSFEAYLDVLRELLGEEAYARAQAGQSGDAREAVTADDKWHQMLDGARVIVSGRDLDWIADTYSDDDAAWAYLKHLRSIPNLDRVGILDAYVAWIDKRGLGAREGAIAEDLWQQIIRGERVIASNRDMDYFERKDEPEVRHLRSRHNHRTGTFVVWIEEK